MHENLKKDNFKIVAMFLCIVLLISSCFSCVFATETTPNEPNFELTVNSMFGSTQKKDGDKIITTIKAQEEGIEVETLEIVPSKTAVYTITLTGIPVGSNTDKELFYRLYREGKEVRLAAKHVRDGEYAIITTDNSPGTTTISVILHEGERYTFSEISTLSPDADNITLVVEEYDLHIDAAAMTNIPASVVSQKIPDYSESNRRLSNAEAPGEFKIIEFTQKEINEFINSGYMNDKNEKKGSYIEGLLADIIIAFGTLFQRIVEIMVNANVKLTMDNIIFNRLSAVVIDITPLGGIKVDDIGKGLFHDGKVLSVINNLYSGLRNLTLIIYGVMLLVIAVKILSEAGGKNQKKYFKYVEYWISGLLIFSILPFFFPAIPAINNVLVEMLRKEAQSLNGDYSTEEILKRLGGDESLLGEDAEVVKLKELIQERIDYLNDQLNDTPTTRIEAQEQIDSLKQNAVVGLVQFDGDTTVLNEKIDKVIDIVDGNFDIWNKTNQKQYEEARAEVRDYIFENSAVSRGLKQQVKNEVPATLEKKYYTTYNYVNSVMDYVSKNATNWSEAEANYNNSLRNIRATLSKQGMPANEVQQTIDAIEKAKRTYVLYGQSSGIQNVETMFNDYQADVIQKDIAELQAMKNSISRDVMAVLKEKAQEDNRVVYAIAWAILLFQMLAVLFMYYRRVITVIILIIVFPVVMAFYVIDKIGDGKSQSLNNWIKEFLANIIVQFLHAMIYVVLVNTGIEICNADPLKNWFFLILTVCFLFPGERILRGILDLNTSTLPSLRNNFGAAVMGAGAALGIGKGAINGAKGLAKGAMDVKKNGGIQATIKKKQEEVQKAREKEEKEIQAKRKKSAQIRRAHARDREQRRLDWNQKAIAGNANILDRGMMAVDKGMQKITGWKKDWDRARMGKSNASSEEIEAWKDKRAAARRNRARTGKMVLKTVGKGFKVARGAAGITMGAVEGMESFAKDGFGSGIATASKVAKDVGGISGFKSVSLSNASSSEAPATRFTSRYENGQKVAGSTPVTSGNIVGNAHSGESEVHGTHTSATPRMNPSEAKTEVRQHIKRVQNDQNS